MNIEANAVPFQRRDVWYVKALKAFLHTKAGAFLGYHLGIAGFNRIEAQISRFKRYHREGEALKRGERVMAIGETGLFGVYAAPRAIQSYNSRVNAGAALNASLISGSTLGGISSPAAPKYIALSTSSLTPAAGDTTLSGETAASGLARAAATAGGYSAPGSLDAAALFTQTKTFTNTSGGSVTVVSAALFDAASSGNLFVEGNLSSSAVLAINDAIQLTWTVNI